MNRRKDKLEVWPGTLRLWNAKKGNWEVPVWRWRIRNGYNGKIVCAGEPNGYTSKAKALAGWKGVVKAAGGEGMGNVEVVEL